MPNLTLELPSMYGDHHVIEVRRLLLDLTGVTDVYASSSFRVVDVTFDDTAVSPDQIRQVLEKAGYLGELPLPAETGKAATDEGEKPFFRHTAAFEQTGQVVSFGQKVPYNGRPLWPCPGMGPVASKKEELIHG
ncbi:MAG: heavy-metal-associated domain-containing protein [Ardenticatenaceae bacterium]|nr:heavy-metal-associated domain-containing protein [Ardenticatenaceae bacterium]